ncbi:MAG: patatin-like phospholipase family protein [Leptospirales bacterium]|nr:patatin-like phospholipase family protein [Leptospirales bacterium]
MQSSPLFGDFLVLNGVISAMQLNAALEAQRDGTLLRSMVALSDERLTESDLAEIIRRHVATGESLEAAAVSLGHISEEAARTQLRAEKKHRIPLGAILMEQGAIDRNTLERWLHRFAGQVHDKSALIPLLQQIHLLQGLDQAILERIANALHLKVYERDETIFYEKDDNDGLYIIESGLVRMSVFTRQEEHELGFFRSGDSFGISGILDARERGQRAIALTKSRLWRLGQSDFRQLVDAYPQFSIAAVRHLSTGLSYVFKSIQGERHLFEANVVTIFAQETSTRCMKLVQQTIRELYREGWKSTQVLYAGGKVDLPAEGTPAAFNTDNAPGPDFTCVRTDRILSNDADWLPGWLHGEAKSIDRLVIIAPAGCSESYARMLVENSARTIVLVEDQIPEFIPALKVGRDRLYVLDSQRAHPIIADIHSRLTVEAGQYLPQLLMDDDMPAGSAFSGDPSRKCFAARKLMRWLAGKTLGLAFGGGGARVLAHIGILDVLIDEEGIEVDEVAGTSGGSVVAGLVALGMSSAMIFDFFDRYTIKSKKNPLVDFTIPIRSIASGKRFEGLLRKGFGNRLVYASKLPYFPVTTDLQTGRIFLPRICPIWKASKASAAIPGFHPVMPIGGRLLGDGGVLNNVPASILRDFGSNTVISLNITVDPSRAKFEKPNVLSALVRGVDIMLFKAVSLHEKYTDLDLRPAVAGYATTDFSHGLQLREIGRACARENIKQIRRLASRAEEA